MMDAPVTMIDTVIVVAEADAGIVTGDVVATETKRIVAPVPTVRVLVSCRYTPYVPDKSVRLAVPDAAM